MQKLQSITDAYKKKLETYMDYKDRVDDLETENEELRNQLFDVELKTNAEQRFQTLYESTREQLLAAKEKLISTDLSNTKLQAEVKDQKTEIKRLFKNVDKKDGLIKQLNFDLGKLKQVEICQSLHDSGLLGENFQYEERIKYLEQEIKELKIENDNYANQELIRLESILQEQKEESLKSTKEKNYYEERCAVLEKQNVELKNRIQNLELGMDLRSYVFIDQITSRNKLQDKSKLLSTNQKLALKLENFEEQINLENSKMKLLKDENQLLKDSLASIKAEKSSLTKLLSKCGIILNIPLINFDLF